MDDADEDDEGENMIEIVEKDDDVNTVFESNNQIPTPSPKVAKDTYNVGFGAPLHYASPEILQQRLREKIRENAESINLNTEAIKKRKEERKVKDEARAAKGFKQKTSQTVPIRKAPKQEVDEDDDDIVEKDVKQHKNKKQKTTENKKTDKKAVLSNPTFTSVIAKKPTDFTIDDNKKQITKGAATKQHLQRLLDFEDKVQRLREDGDEKKAEALVHNRSVDTALARALGENINDNIRSIKNEVKKIERQKEKSAKSWKRREATQKQQQSERQDTRNLHIQKKIDHKKQKRLDAQEKRKFK